MAGFFSRLDKYVDSVIDLDALWGKDQLRSPTPIKVIFDNLRYYTVLVFMWLGVKLLRDSAYTVTAYSLGGFVLVLGLLTVMQTAAILMAAAFSGAFSLLPRAQSVRLRRSIRSRKITIKLLTVLIVVPIVVLVMSIASSLFAALSRANLL